MKKLSYCLLLIATVFCMTGCQGPLFHIADSSYPPRKEALVQFDDLSRHVCIVDYYIGEELAYFTLSEEAQIYFSYEWDGPWVPLSGARMGCLYCVKVPDSDAGYFVAMKGSE